MRSKILAFLLFSTSALAFNKDFKTVNDRVPLEFAHLFESLKRESRTPLEQVQLVGICKELDENLGFLSKDQIYFLMKEEVLKNVLEYKHKKVRSFDVTALLITRLKDEFEKKNKFLTPFSRFIYRSFLGELEHRQRMGLITSRSFSIGQFEGAKRAEAVRFERYLRYLMPWIDKMDSLEPGEFNKLTKEVSWVILKRLNARSLLFKRFASTATTDSKITIFNIPGKLLDLRPEEIKEIQKDPTPLTLKEESEKEKTEARKQVQGTTPDDLSPLSDEVSDELTKELKDKAP